jgi:hypothetical protein
MRDLKDITIELYKEFLKDDQNFNNILILSIEKSQIDMFRFLYNESKKEENLILSKKEFFDKMMNFFNEMNSVVIF